MPGLFNRNGTWYCVAMTKGNKFLVSPCATNVAKPFAVFVNQ